jgi:hypothetical protein
VGEHGVRLGPQGLGRAGLWAYDQTYGKPISKLPGSIVANVALVIGRAVTAVYNKVQHFRHLDPRDGKGLESGGDTAEKLWAEFFDATSNTLRSGAVDDEYRGL